MAVSSESVGRVLAALLDLVLPTSCAGCRAAGNAWCSSCAAECTPAWRLTRPSPCPAGFPLTSTAADYSGVVREALLAHKEHGRRAARPALAALLAAAVEGVLTGPGEVILVPVPSSRSAVRARGGDPVHAMTCAAAVLLRNGGVDGGGVDGGRGGARRVRVMRALVQVRTPDDQSGLTAEQRARNLEGVLAVKPAALQRLLGGKVVIVDDVCTTGATLTEAARALGSAGVIGPRAAVVAATVRRRVMVDGRDPAGDLQIGQSGLSSVDRPTQSWDVPT